MSLKGKGIWIWKILQCEGGNANSIASIAANAGFSHVLIKIADAASAYNIDKATGKDLIPPVVDAIRAKGLQVWGWHYVYGYNPSGEAAIAINQVKKYNLDGYVVDAEIEYQQAGREAVARAFMSSVRSGLPNTPIALSTYRWPSYHKTFPYVAFLEKCDYNMPQVYWMQAHNPAYDLTKSFNEFKAISPYRPLIPTGAAFSESGWTPTADDLKVFSDTAKSLGLSGCNYYSWDDCRNPLPTQWNMLLSYNWPGDIVPPVPADILDKVFYVLNKRAYEIILDIYAENAVLVTSEKTIQGNINISNYYGQLLTNRLNDGVFKVTSLQSSDNTRHFTWTCDSWRAKVNDGSDTIGIKDGKIVYHYSHFTTS